MDPKGVGYGERNKKLLKPKVLTCALQVQRLDFMPQPGMLERAPTVWLFHWLKHGPKGGPVGKLDRALL